MLWTRGKDHVFKEIIILDQLEIQKYRLSLSQVSVSAVFSQLDTSFCLVQLPLAAKVFAHLLRGLAMNSFSFYLCSLNIEV